MQWVWDGIDNKEYKGGLPFQPLPALSLMEIMDELPEDIMINGESFDLHLSKSGGWALFYRNPSFDVMVVEGNSAPDTAAARLIKLKESS